MRPWISKFAGHKVINFVFYSGQIGKLVERIFDGKRCLGLVVNDLVFADAVLAVMEEKLWLSRELDPFYFDAKAKIVKTVKFEDTAGCNHRPAFFLPLGDYFVEISHGVNSLEVSFPVSKFVEEAIAHLERNPVISLCDTAERQRIFKERWQEMLESLDAPSPDTAKDL